MKTEEIIKSFLDGNGKVTLIPSKRKKKLFVLFYLYEKLEKGRVYTEKEINESLNNWHTFGDPATLRRDLCDYKFVTREKDGSSYTVTDSVITEDDIENMCK